MRSLFRYFFAGSAVLLSLTATSCGDRREGWDGVVLDSAGVPIVRNGSVGAWGEEDRWWVTPDLQIGRLDGPPELQFGDISGLALGIDGQIVVLDRLARELRVFDHDGEFLYRMSRAGAGPGEISQSVRQVLYIGDGVVAVPDLAMQRLTLYRLDGTAAGSIPIDMSNGIPAAWAVSPEMDIIYQATVLPLADGTGERQNVLLTLRRDGSVDHFFDLPTGGQLSASGGEYQFRMFASEPRWAVGHEGGVVVGMSGAYRLEMRDSAGKLQRVFTMPHEPRPIGPNDQDLVRRSMQDVLVAEGSEPMAAREATSTMAFAEYYPAFASVRSGPEGTIWVQDVRTPEIARMDSAAFDVRQQGDRRWDVFDKLGRFLGVVVLPVGFEVMDIGDRYIHGRAHDPSGSPQVVRLTLHRPR